MSDSPVAIDLLTQSLRFSGLTTDPNQFRRLSDVLNSAENDLLLSQVTVRNLLGVTLDGCDTAVVQKRDVLLVVPRESTNQLAQRRMQRLGVTAPNLTRLQVLVAVPPYLAKGLVNFRDPRDFYWGASDLGRFFPILEATLRLEAAVVEQAPVILVNREAVVAIGTQEEVQPRPAEPAETPAEVYRPVA